MNHRRTARGRLTAFALIVTTTLHLAACGGGPRNPEGTRTDMPQTATKTGDGTERHDLDPLTSRTPALQAVQDATWYSGTLGSSDAPGRPCTGSTPSSYSRRAPRTSCGAPST